MNLSSDIQEYIEDFGAPNTHLPFSEEEKRHLYGKFPGDLTHFMEVYGRTIFQEGQIQLCHPNDYQGVLALIFGGDPSFSHQNCHAYSYSVFGEIFCWHQDYGLTIVDILDGEITCRSLTKNLTRDPDTDRTFITPFGTDADVYDVNDKLLFKRALKKLGRVDIGECYGFVPALALGGSRDIEHLKRLDAPEHFAIVVQTVEFILADVEGYGMSKTMRQIG